MKQLRKVKVFADPKYGKKTGDADVARMPWLSRGHILMLVVNFGVAYLMFDNVARFSRPKPSFCSVQSESTL